MKHLPRLLLALLALAFVQITVASAEDPVASHRQRYEQISGLLKGCKVIKKALPNDPFDQEFEAWLNKGDAVRVDITSPGEHGWDRDEYYYENGKMFFVFRTSETESLSGKTRREENRFYFNGKKLIRWLGPDKKPHDKDDLYVSEEETLVVNAKRGFDIANGKPDPLAPGAEPETDGEADAKEDEAETKKGDADEAVTGVTVGKFSGVDQGDYSHFNLDLPSGEQESYFILNPDAATEKVLDSPDKFLRRKCKVTWKESEQDIPEAGGKMQVKEITGLEWVK